MRLALSRDGSYVLEGSAVLVHHSAALTADAGSCCTCFGVCCWSLWRSSMLLPT